MQTTENKIMIAAQDVKAGDTLVTLFNGSHKVHSVATDSKGIIWIAYGVVTRPFRKGEIVTVIRKVEPEVMAQDQQEVELAAQVVNYCRSKALSLGGLVERINAAGHMTRETADAVILYCQENSLTLGGLVDTLASYSNSVADAEDKRATMTAEEISNYILANWSDYDRVPKCVNDAHLEATDNTLATFQESGQESTPGEFYAVYMRNLVFVLTCTEFGTAQACEWFKARGVKY